MSFEAFVGAVASPALKRIACHWNDARGFRRFPGWRDIKPSAIAAQLPLLWSYRYDREKGLFTGRLAGERITAIFGRSFRDLPMSEAYPPEAYPAFFARSERVVLEPALMRGHGAIYAHMGRAGMGERILLPLADDGEQGDGILGATDYDIHSEPTRKAVDAGEILEWFAVDQVSP